MSEGHSSILLCMIFNVLVFGFYIMQTCFLLNFDKNKSKMNNIVLLPSCLLVVAFYLSTPKSPSASDQTHLICFFFEQLQRKITKFWASTTILRRVCKVFNNFNWFIILIHFFLIRPTIIKILFWKILNKMLQCLCQTKKSQKDLHKLVYSLLRWIQKLTKRSLSDILLSLDRFLEVFSISFKIFVLVLRIQKSAERDLKSLQQYQPKFVKKSI